jgi:hypothetical protein
MAKTLVYRSYEVREGFGPGDVGRLRFESESRGDADRLLEELSIHGISVQLFGVRSDDDERVLLRTLVARSAA